MGNGTRTHSGFQMLAGRGERQKHIGLCGSSRLLMNTDRLAVYTTTSERSQVITECHPVGRMELRFTDIPQTGGNMPEALSKRPS